MSQTADTTTLRPRSAAAAGTTNASTRGLADRRVRLLGVTVLAVAGGLVAGWLTPRGPATTFEALAWIAGSLAIGVAAGLLTTSRWSLLLAPAAFLAAFELTRVGTVGPTVQIFQPTSTYGLIAIAVGRGVTYLLALLPMATGAGLGVGLASRLGRTASAPRGLGRIGWAMVLAGAIVTAGMAYAFSQPARTPAILGADGEPLPGSITELRSVELGGHEQALMIRGRDVDAPVLLHLAGGPGGTDLGAMRADTSLEDHFVVVTWDQRGSGKSYTALDPVSTLTTEQMVADTIELSEYLRERFDEQRIYLHGNSWGATLGVLAAQQRPDLYHAYIGSGQMVSQRLTDVMFWEDTIAWAESVGDEGLAASLREMGPPPYEDILEYELALSHEHDFNPYPEWDGGKEMPFNLFVPENDLMDRINGMRGFLDTFAVLYPQLQDIDFRTDVPELEVPVYLVQGTHEARGRAVLAEEWFSLLEAPSKELIVFPSSGHRPTFEEPARFAQLMERVLEETYPTDEVV